MKIKVSDISETGLHILTFRKPEWLINVPDLISGEDGTNLSSNLNFDLRVTRVLKEVAVQGKIWFSIESPCARCLRDVDLIITPEVNLVLSPGNVSDEKDNKGDIQHEAYSGDEIDLGDYLREVITMSLPIKVLCDEECRGLCASCGANLNTRECSCREDWVDSRFGVLRNLKI
ncbi:MAG TPA: DUF177 domain-containing protein [Thermodesulfobacteriota bacterium]|nr:DUF177 domain-containing protein [Thermodesulfobacteriota bacterium]